MNALSKFAADAYLATQSAAVKDVVRGIEDAWGLDLDTIRRGYTEKAFAARRALICALANLGLPLKKIREISHTDIDETMEILNERRDYGVPVKTMSWGM